MFTHFRTLVLSFILLLPTMMIQSADNAALFDIPMSDDVHMPKTVEELTSLVQDAKKNKTTISIVGAGKSQGGQTTAGKNKNYRISLSKLNHLITLDVLGKTVTVQAGMTWGQLQKYIAPHGLAVSCMQSYNDFSIGGSLGVNVHGQDFRHGPLISTVQEFKLLQSDGTIIIVNHQKNAELFGAAIGGYGLFGIITEVTLKLVDDMLLDKFTEEIDADELADYFIEHIKDNKEIEFYSARFSIGSWNLLNKAFVIYYKKSETSDQDLFDYAPDGFKAKVSNKSSAKTAAAFTKSSFLRNCRLWLERLMLQKKITMSRNNLMSYSLKSLPQDTNKIRYILQEYFVPYEQLNSFIKKMKKIVKMSGVKLLNVTARHIEKNTEAMLSFSGRESCALVLYIPVEKTEAEYAKTVLWTQHLIDAALACKGTYYLPYQLLATKEQLHKAYPIFNDFVALKKMYDPQELFINALYEKYA